jgi:N-methylhydantoinase B
MNSIIATTRSSIYLAIKDVFSEVLIYSGTFEPLIAPAPAGTFLDAKCPRPMSGCAPEVSQRIADAIFLALTEALPDPLFLAPSQPAANINLDKYSTPPCCI